jgi:hypothetical protein
MVRVIATLFIACLLALTITGCSNSAHSTTLARSQIVVDKTLSAIAQVKSYKLDTDFTDVSGFTEWQGTRVVDVPDKEMAMNMEITMGPSPSLNVSDEMYFTNGQEYLKTVSEGNFPQTVGWTKRNLVDDVWDQQTQIPFLTELLKTASKISSMETEQLNNVNCYVLTITPSAQASADFVLSQGQPGGPGFFSIDVEGGWMITADLYNAGSIKLWISQDDYLPLKVEAEFDFKQAKGNLPVDTAPSKVINNYHNELEFSDYNQPIAIQLPQDALSARNVGYDKTENNEVIQFYG